MAHFAKVENGIVTDVVVVANEHESNGNEYLNELGLTGTWVQTSYNSTFGKKFAAIGDIFIDGDFQSPQPFPSWTFDLTAWAWIAPVARPSEGGPYKWDEDTRDWVVKD